MKWPLAWSTPFLLVGTLWFSGCGASAPRRVGDYLSERPPLSSLAKAVVRTAKKYLPEEGVPHPSPLDCSDFVDKVFSAHGMKLPRTAAAMSIVGERIKNSKELRMGDLVFFSGSRRNRIVGHVGIYVNNGIFIHFSRPEVGVTMESLYSDYYRKRYLMVRRVLTDQIITTLASAKKSHK
ncbi:MAG: C40 family peptidase [Elusimicrobia bacterium]|nr:C40 family peptidase [Elusimicrobiota bacterium]